MTQEGQQKLIDYLKALKLGQPFTIKDLVRNIGRDSGEQWAGFFE